MNEKYNPLKIEIKWQKRWEKENVFHVFEDPNKKKYYVLEMFPYPSGNIHMGHVRNYMIGDVIARFKKMNGFNVLHPIGWDSFGMPAENAAINYKIHPANWTKNNIEHMKKQLKRIGFSYDWSREIYTSDPNYYRWEQLFFLWMYNENIVYRKSSKVNWCPTCRTVLANEQVINSNFCWRCSTKVTLKVIKQWFFKITQYVEELLTKLDLLENKWPQNVINMQKRWIGKSVGFEIKFPILNSNLSINVFTTRCETIFGVTFIILAFEHYLIKKIIKKLPENENKSIIEFIKKNKEKKERQFNFNKDEIEGIFLGNYCIHPLTGEKIPIFATNFIFANYGTGAVMAVPAHDERDFQFAKKFNLPIKIVIKEKNNLSNIKSPPNDIVYIEKGVLVNSDKFNGLDSEIAHNLIANHIEKLGIGKKVIQYKLNDWCISRQRYWGTPIPIIYCNQCGIVPVPEKDLPIILPYDIDLTGKGKSPLKQQNFFLNVKCPKCKANAKRETDTMDTFVESSWYFNRFASPNYENSPGLDKDKIKYWLPVDQYIGGIEHAILHLLYARFYTKVLRDFKIITFDEPFINLLTQGMVCKETIKCLEHNYLLPQEVNNNKCIFCNREVSLGKIEKMSKSLKNIVSPDEIIKKYGADTTRLFCLFAAPPEKNLEWNDQSIEGAFRFIGRLWRIVINYINYEKNSFNEGEEDKEIKNNNHINKQLKLLKFKTHQTLKKVTFDMNERFHFNTIISSIMELINFLYQIKFPQKNKIQFTSIFRETIEIILIILNPIIPHITEELWEKLGHKTILVNHSWPIINLNAIFQEEKTLIIQINGKFKNTIKISTSLTKDEVIKIVLINSKVKNLLKIKKIEKIIYVPYRIINILLK